MTDAGAPHHLRVCRTCPRYERRPPGTPSAGTLLAARLKALSGGGSPPVRVLGVACLSGCPNPCNVLLDGPCRPVLRIGGCGADDAAALWALAERYRQAGDLTPADLAALPAARITARTPPPERAG